jgi:hypothetical protein
MNHCLGHSSRNIRHLHPRHLLLLLLVFIALKSIAQHDHHVQMPADTATHHHAIADSIGLPAEPEMPMSHAYSLNLPMNRNGSGTSWLPDSTLMYGHGVHLKKWMLMLHENIFIRYNHQDITNKGERGGEKFDVPNWLMLMGQRKVKKKGLFVVSAMFSMDPLTVGNEGYPLLFQTGETYQGQPLVDRQHPHDLFSGLSVAYTQMITKDIDLSGYIGFPGEPASGPVTFMHRPSAMNNPDAPLGHHWQDATHITFGAATLGLRLWKIKIEGSDFTGMEPDENRYNFDAPLFDSYSWRVLFSPAAQLTLFVSQSFIHSHEAAHPHEDITRNSAGLIHDWPFGLNRYLATSVVWGQNRGEQSESSVLVESALQLDRNAIYWRYEWVEKSAGELDLRSFINGHDPVFSIQAFTAGINRVLLRKAGFNIALGTQGSIYLSDSRLEALYGHNPLALEIYLRLYPHLMHAHGEEHTMSAM